MKLEDYVITIPNFPKEGIMFRDITSVIENKDGLKLAIDSMQSLIKDTNFDYIIAPESRGFIFGMPIAYNLNKGFIPIRKKGKLPRKTISEEYELEYGTACIEMNINAIKKGDKVVIVDDLLATGGTIKAIINMVEKKGAIVVKVCSLIELVELKGKEKLSGYDVVSCIKYDGK